MGTIYILWLRQLKRYLRSGVRVFASLAQPLLFLVAFGFGFSGVFRRAGAGNYIQFLAPGVIGMGVLNFLVMPLFFLSGALFPLNQVPSALKRASRSVEFGVTA